MRNRNIIYIASCIIISLLAISVLYSLSLSNENSHIKNSFTRSFKPQALQNIKVLDIGTNTYYIAGITATQIFLGNILANNYLLKINYTLADTLFIQLNIPKDEKLARGSFNTLVDYPNIYITEGITPTILHATFPQLNYERLKLDSNTRFTASMPISKHSFVVRTYDNQRQQNILIKESAYLPSQTYAYTALEKQLDGVFCTDGMLLYDSDVSQLVYLYFYRNQFVGLDTNMNVIYRGNTIDSTKRASIKLEYGSSSKKAIVTSPPSFVNKHSCVNKGRLFVHSGLLADNESKELFEKSSVIDVYSLKDQRYQYSFYLPTYKNKKMFEFRVFDDKVVALYHHYIITYDLKKT